MAQRDIELAFNDQLGRKADKQESFRAVITDNVGNRTGTGTIWRNQNRREVWFQAWGSGNIGWGLCDNIEPVIGLPVIVAFEPLIGGFEVIRTDPIVRATATDQVATGRVISNSDVARGGRFQLWLEEEMLQPLATYPGTGLAVNIVAGDYEYFGTRKTYDGATEQDISAHQPAGPNEHLLVGLYLNSSNALQQIAGSTVATGTDAPEPSWPAGAFRLSVVDLDDSQTTISLADDIENRRLLWSFNRETLTTKGDILTYDTDLVRLGVGSDTQVLTADSAQSEGIKWDNVEGATLTINNGSGATANANDLGYIDANGDYQTTTTAEDVVEWCVVIIGGANGSDIVVRTRGKVTVAYAGSAPSDGDFLTTSTTAGSAQARSMMHPAIFARATAAGSGGTVEALLLTQRTPIKLSDPDDIIRVVGTSDSTFVAKINSAGSGGLTATNVPYDNVVGNEDSLDVASTSELGKLVLHNTTRGTYRLITAVDTVNDAITTVSSSDSWADNDDIQVDSQTNLDTSGSAAFYDVDLSQSGLPETLIMLSAEWVSRDTSTVGSAGGRVHPFETHDGQKMQTHRNENTSVAPSRHVDIPIIEQRFCIRFEPSGSGTLWYIMKLVGGLKAAP